MAGGVILIFRCSTDFYYNARAKDADWQTESRESSGCSTSATTSRGTFEPAWQSRSRRSNAWGGHATACASRGKYWAESAQGRYNLAWVRLSNSDKRPCRRPKPISRTPTHKPYRLTRLVSLYVGASAKKQLLDLSTLRDTSEKRTMKQTLPQATAGEHLLPPLFRD